MTTVLLALTASLVIGTSDYLGGRASERMHPMLAALGAQATYLVVAPPLALVIGATAVTGADIAWGLAAGAASGSAYLLFFTALATGRMGVAAPVTAALSAAVPVGVDIVQGIDLRTGRWIGLALALVAVPIVAYTPSVTPVQAATGSVGAAASSVGRTSTSTVVLLSGAAGVLFAGFFLALGNTSPDSGQWPFVASAVTSTSTIAIACSGAIGLGRLRWQRPSRLAVASGACGAVAGACVTEALQEGPVAVVSVLGSLFPIATVALAARFSQERVRWWHMTGLGLAVAGAALVAVYA